MPPFTPTAPVTLAGRDLEKVRVIGQLMGLMRRLARKSLKEIATANSIMHALRNSHVPLGAGHDTSSSGLGTGIDTSSSLGTGIDTSSSLGTGIDTSSSIGTGIDTSSSLGTGIDTSSSSLGAYSAGQGVSVPAGAADATTVAGIFIPKVEGAPVTGAAPVRVVTVGAPATSHVVQVVQETPVQTAPNPKLLRALAQVEKSIARTLRLESRTGDRLMALAFRIVATPAIPVPTPPVVYNRRGGGRRLRGEKKGRA